MLWGLKTGTTHKYIVHEEQNQVEKGATAQGHRQRYTQINENLLLFFFKY